MEFASGEVLIQVCHFNNVVQSVYGIPIFIKIKNNEKLIDVRRRIQKTLNVSDKVRNLLVIIKGLPGNFKPSQRSAL